jgi:hypothetical protein
MLNGFVWMAVAEAEIVSVIIAIIAQIRAECKGRIFLERKNLEAIATHGKICYNSRN